MAQHYTNPSSEANPYALPNAETFQAYPTTCRSCGAGSCLVQGEQLVLHVCPECGGKTHDLDTKLQWFWQPCFPGCLPDGPPNGPFETQQAAVDNLTSDEA